MGNKNRSKNKRQHQYPYKGTIQKNSFNIRQYDRNKHNNPLSSPDEKSKDGMKEIDKLFESVFFDHNAVYSLETNNDWDSKRKLAHKFFNSEKYYSIPDIKCMRDDKNVTPEEFIQKVFGDSTHGNKNKISFFLGKVGRGKTAYINYLITKHFPYRRDKMLFIRFDVETNNIINARDLTQLIVERISEQFIEIIEKWFDSLRNNPKVKDYITSLKAEIEKNDKNYVQLKKYLGKITGSLPIKFVIIIDNIDILYQNTKKGFYRDSSKEFYKKLNDVIKIFMPTNDLDSLCANILFVMREETYDYVRMLNHKEKISSITHYFNDDNRYEIQEYDWEKIIKGRFDMLVDLVSENKTEYDNFDQILSHIQNVNNYLYHKEIDLLATIKKMANSGLREMMRYLNQYSYMSYLNIGRLIKDEPVGIIAYILKGKRLYSNVESDITNIYSNEFSGKMKIPTYWLKFLLVKYLEQRKKIQTEIEDIYRTFCPTQKGFTRDQVHNVIDELSNSNESNMIDLKQEYDSQKETTKTFLTITEKGSYLIKDVFNKFYYLQLIVDDYKLVLPDLFLNESLFNYETSDDYSYILLQEDEYSAAASNVIKRKGQEVILFLILLKVSLIAEKIEYKTVFDGLKNISINVGDIIKSIKEELGKIYNSKYRTKRLIPFTDNFDSYINEIDVNSHNKEIELKNIYNLS
jgi:hypothetical protein